ncbi:MAG: NADH:flavin oxidoreductase [Caulobacterales bacterium]|jgi:2,4-dienoyl-CoA reductase-like NADH-dependent reductase (Old Yellow Enzyme family)
MTSPLFTPYTLKGLTLPNRIVMAPMTRSFSPNGVPSAGVPGYYRRRAEAAVGLIVTEGVGVDRPASRNEPNVPFFCGEALPHWAEVAKEVKAAHGLIMPQLWHVGALRNPMAKDFAPRPVDSPSGMASPGKPFAEPMTLDAIDACIAAFGQAAADAQRLGYAGVELHGAHGYLIDQFFWAGTNERTDQWGGATLGERTRFAVALLKACRAATSPDFTIGIRLSQWKQQDFTARLAETPDEMAAWLSPLVDAGADFLHCSQRRFWEPEFPGSDLNFAGWAKKLTGKPVITVGSVGLSGEFVAAFRGEASQPASLDELERRLDRGDFDLVGVGRALLADPQWALKIRDGRTNELSSFTAEALKTLS